MSSCRLYAPSSLYVAMFCDDATGLYISSVKPGLANPIDPEAILTTSRRNNARDNVSGLLFFNGKRFLQALEGDDAMVDATYARIQRDPRHCAGR